MRCVAALSVLWVGAGPVAGPAVTGPARAEEPAPAAWQENRAMFVTRTGGSVHTEAVTPFEVFLQE